MSVSEEIHKAVEGLSPDDQRKVLSFVLKLKTVGEDANMNPTMFDLFGTVPAEEVDEMMRCIDEAFERIEPGEW